MPQMRLRIDDSDAIQNVLSSAGLLSMSETVSQLSIPGAGNMNFTVRVETSKSRSFIVKQARDYVEKYPSIPAPRERSHVEARFYETVQSDAMLGNFTPKLLHHDPTDSILVIEDLGHSTDFTSVYDRKHQIEEHVLGDLTRFLNVLHLTFPRTADHDFPKNRSMRELNAEHIFRFPFVADNGFDLDTVTPGLEALANTYRRDERLLSVAHDLQSIYLADGDTLIHGDYYPGSWLQTTNGTRIIDPEFGFIGPKEFDLGVMLAHLMMSAQSDETLELTNTMYQPVDLFDPDLCRKFIGIEVFRRLIGLAQIPLQASLDEKAVLLKTAYEMLLS